MRSPALLIRSASFLLIAPGFSIGDTDVYVYDALAPDEGLFPRVILQGITGGGQAFSKCGFGSDWFQSIKITTSFRAGVSSNLNDAIADRIVTILCPFSGPYMDLGAPFHIWNAWGQILNTLSYDDGVLKYLDTDIQINYSITETNT